MGSQATVERCAPWAPWPQPSRKAVFGTAVDLRIIQHIIETEAEYIMEPTDKAKAGGSRDMGYIKRDSSFAWIELLKAAHILLVRISEGRQAHYAILLLPSCIVDVQAFGSNPGLDGPELPRSSPSDDAHASELLRLN